jgi:predicted dithiol-disulfide oxidoreductase (DUF899 family)
MAHETIDGIYRQTNLRNESPEYLRAREELRLAEIALTSQREKVAVLRRNLPPGAIVEDYEFLEGPPALDDGDGPIRPVRLSELFSSAERALVVYQFMYGKANSHPCPMCTSWLDCFNGIAHHLAQNIDLAVVAAADVPTLRAHARTREWHRLRLLSAGESSFKYDLGGEDAEGNQDSTISVFTLDESGAVRHFYSVHPRLADDIDTRGIDEYNPVWNILDLTPRGRGDWDASLDYGTTTEFHRSNRRSSSLPPRELPSAHFCGLDQRAD